MRNRGSGSSNAASSAGSKKLLLSLSTIVLVHCRIWVAKAQISVEEMMGFLTVYACGESNDAI
jgi:hypothetical protein